MLSLRPIESDAVDVYVISYHRCGSAFSLNIVDRQGIFCADCHWKTLFSGLGIVVPVCEAWW